ncbi:MAG: HAMP domain-containing histidine kinase [Clostridiaceae bacterium]|nr:HAMP domain-containing histidine kinase [Clostridiaceae bacterium]
MSLTDKKRIREMFGAKLLLFMLSVALIMTFFFSIMQMGFYFDRQQYNSMESSIYDPRFFWDIDINQSIVQSLPEDTRYAYYHLLMAEDVEAECSHFLANYLKSTEQITFEQSYTTFNSDRIKYIKYNIYNEDGALLTSSAMGSLSPDEMNQIDSADIQPAESGDEYLYRAVDKLYVYATSDYSDSYFITKYHAPQSGYYDVDEMTYIVEIFVDRLYLESDFYFSQASRHLSLIYNYGHWIPFIVVASVIAFIVCLRLLLSGMATKRKALPSYLRFLDYVPMEMLLLGCVLVSTFAIDVSEWYSYMTYVPINASSLTLMSIIIAIDVGMLCLIALKKSSRGILHYSITRAIFQMLREIIENLHAVWKLVLIIISLMVIEICVVLIFAPYESSIVLGLFFVAACSIIGGSWIAVKYQRLCELSQKIAEGQLDYPMHESLKKGFFKVPARHISQIRQSIGIAVDEQLKSERFKTELITNVSHDIKTPLTSIVNYTDLLEKHISGDDTAKEYIEVISRNSQKLKKLTDDVIDAAKLSSGVHIPQIGKFNLTELVRQVCGEFEERFEREGIELVTAYVSERINVMSDARMAGRVLDNLLGNALKYSMPNSRVYVDMIVNQDRVEVRVRNISKTPLNIAPQELLERFVRADTSRSTDGSGLGLSIADSLMRAMGGKLELSIDADLFTARAIFNYREENGNESEPSQRTPAQD